MKISEMPTEQARQTIVRILPHIRNLTADGKVKELLAGGVAKQKTGDPLGATVTAAVDISMWLLEDGSDDSYAIIAALTQKSVKEIKEQPIKTTVADLNECVDRELVDFFTSQLQQATNRLSASRT